MKTVKTKAKAKSQPVEIDLDEHNRHLKILGLPAVKKPRVEGPPATPMPRARKGSPLAMLDHFNAGEGPTAPRGRFIHWWGQFSGELPAPFKLKSGGHGYLEAKDVEHATKLFAVLRKAVLQMKPKLDPDDDDAEAIAEYGLERTREWAGISADGLVWYRWMRTDGKQMTVELKHTITKKELAGDRLLKPR